MQDKDENAQFCSRRGFLAVAASFPAVLMPGGAAGQPRAGAGSTILDSGPLAQTTVPVSSTAVTRLHGPNPFSPYKQAISLEGNVKKAGNPERLAAYNFWIFPVESEVNGRSAGQAKLSGSVRRSDVTSSAAPGEDCNFIPPGSWTRRGRTPS